MMYNQQLIFATFVCDVDRVKYLIQQSEFDPTIIEDIKIYDRPFPLYYLTLLAKQVFADQYIDSFMPLVLKIRSNIDAMTTYWYEQFGIDITSMRVDYRQYADYFYCTPMNETFLPPIEQFAHLQPRVIDYELFEQAAKFNLEQVESLLEQGANPNFEFYTLEDARLAKEYDSEIDSLCILAVISNEVLYLGSGVIMPIFEQYYASGETCDLINNEIDDLLGLAAHSEMENLLCSYD